MNKEKLIEKLNGLENRFNKDSEVIELINMLKTKFDTHFNETFTQEEIESEEFDEMSEEYYCSLRENDPDDTTIFEVVWFK